MLSSNAYYDIQTTSATITVSGLSNGINSFVANQGGTSDIQFGNILNPANENSTFVTDSFHIQGVNFYKWFMGADCIQSLDLDNTFLVVETILNLCNTDKGYLGGYKYISSWYGYINHNINSISDIDPGRSRNIRDRMARIGNGFAFGGTEYATNDILTKVQSVLGLSIPTVKLPETVGANFNFTDKNYDVYGYGIQAYWLRNLEIEQPKDPIDTYDIDMTLHIQISQRHQRQHLTLTIQTHQSMIQ